MNADRLARMKPTAFSLNTAEPPKQGSVLIGAKNVQAFLEERAQNVVS